MPWDSVAGKVVEDEETIRQLFTNYSELKRALAEHLNEQDATNARRAERGEAPVFADYVPSPPVDPVAGNRRLPALLLSYLVNGKKESGFVPRLRRRDSMEVHRTNKGKGIRNGVVHSHSRHAPQRQPCSTR